jgi:hypothetical protein
MRIVVPARRRTELIFCPCHDEKSLSRFVFRPANLDEDPAQRRNCDIDQVANRKFRGLEIDSDHCADFEIDEQKKKDVRKFGPSFTQYAEESRNGRPDRRSPYCKQRQVVKSVKCRTSNPKQLVIPASEERVLESGL